MNIDSESLPYLCKFLILTSALSHGCRVLLLSEGVIQTSEERFAWYLHYMYETKKIGIKLSFSSTFEGKIFRSHGIRKINYPNLGSYLEWNFYISLKPDQCSCSNIPSVIYQCKCKPYQYILYKIIITLSKSVRGLGLLSISSRGGASQPPVLYA